MRFDKWAVTAQEALQAAIGIATDANAGQVEPIHLLKALLSSGERNLRAIIERVGADRVIQPEKEIGQRLAQHLGRTNVIDYIGFSDDFSILEIKTPRSWIGKTIGQLGVRARYGINVLAIRHGEGGVTDVTPGADGLISENDLLVILGTNDKVDKVVELK